MWRVLSGAFRSKRGETQDGNFCLQNEVTFALLLLKNKGASMRVCTKPGDFLGYLCSKVAHYSKSVSSLEGV